MPLSQNSESCSGRKRWFGRRSLFCLISLSFSLGCYIINSFLVIIFLDRYSWFPNLWKTRKQFQPHVAPRGASNPPRGEFLVNIASWTRLRIRKQKKQITDTISPKEEKETRRELLRRRVISLNLLFLEVCRLHNFILYKNGFFTFSDLTVSYNDRGSRSLFLLTHIQ